MIYVCAFVSLMFLQPVAFRLDYILTFGNLQCVTTLLSFSRIMAIQSTQIDNGMKQASTLQINSLPMWLVSSDSCDYLQQK